MHKRVEEERRGGVDDDRQRTLWLLQQVIISNFARHLPRGRKCPQGSPLHYPRTDMCVGLRRVGGP